MYSRKKLKKQFNIEISLDSIEKAMKHVKRKDGERMTFEQLFFLLYPLSKGIAKLAEVVGSTSPQSISFCVRNTVLF
jgi:hypothetical protein